MFDSYKESGTLNCEIIDYNQECIQKNLSNKKYVLYISKLPCKCISSNKKY